MNMRSHASFVVGIVLLAVSACAPLDTTEQVCRLMPELDSSTVALDRAFDDLAATDPGVLESSLSVLIDTITSLLDGAPTEIESSLSTLDRSYREVRLALINVDFDGKIAVNDAATTNALSNLRRSDVIRASERLEAFVEERCSTRFDAPIPPALGDGATLPTPIQTPEETDEYPFVVEDEPSSLTAYGFLLVNGRGVTLSDDEAECVGRSVSIAAQDVGNPDDATLDALVSQALSRCQGGASTSTTVPEVSASTTSGD
jgi:hypothetical protein